MNISKYIELLRFYLTEKVDEMNETLNRTINDELRDVLSNLLSAIFSVFISNVFVQDGGWVGCTIGIVIAIALFFVLRFIFSRLLRFGKTYNETKQADKRELTSSEAKKIISRFDHVACDGVLLSWDFFEKYNQTCTNKFNERLFYLFETFYYYNKAICVTELVVYYHKDCINSSSKSSGISLYRLVNIYNSLIEISKLFDDIIVDENCVFERKDEFSGEVIKTQNKLLTIGEFINKKV